MLRDNEKNFFVHRSLLSSHDSLKMLLEFIENHDVMNHSIISKSSENELKVTPATPNQQHLSLMDLHFQLFVKQKENAGYLYCSLETLKTLDDLTSDEEDEDDE